MKKSIFAGSLVGLLVGVLVVSILHTASPKSFPLAGGFSGNHVPDQLWTGSADTNSVTPIPGLPNLYLTGALSVGGNGQYNQLSAFASASGTPASAATLGPLGTSTSTATTSITLSNTAGLSVGAICAGGVATTSLVAVSACTLTSTNGATGTATVAYENLTAGALAVPTSTVLRISFQQLPY